MKRMEWDDELDHDDCIPQRNGVGCVHGSRNCPVDVDHRAPKRDPLGWEHRRDIRRADRSEAVRLGVELVLVIIIGVLIVYGLSLYLFTPPVAVP
jgi:hypothetical protein